MRKNSLSNLSIITILVMGFSLIFSQGLLAAGKKPWELINWDKPLPAAERLSADEYILPQGWREATKGVKYILHFNAGGMQHDPGTLANFQLFEKLTGIKVKYVEVSDQVLLQKTISALVSRDPNVTSMCVSEPAYSLQHLIAAGWIEKWDEVWSPDVQAIYPPGLVQLLKGTDGHLYGTVDTQKAAIMYARPSWLKAAGVKIPTTWGEVIVAAKKCREWALANLGPTYWGIGFPGDHYILQHLQAVTYSQGGRLIVNGKVNLLTPEFKNTWETFVNFIAKDKSAPEAILGWTWNDYQQAFAMGKQAICDEGLNTNMVRFKNPEQSPGVQNDVFGNPVKGGDWVAFPTPKWSKEMPETYRGAAPTNFSAYVINKYAPDNAKAAAMLLGEVRMSKQGGINELLIEGNSPFLPAVFDYPEVMAKVDYVDVRRIANQNAVLEVFPPGAEAMLDILLEYYGKTATGKLPALEALKKAAAEVEDLLYY